MKKLMILLMAIAMFAVTSCKDTVNGFVYNVNVEGNAAGEVVVVFPNGSLDLGGDANLLFHYSNDTDTTNVIDIAALDEVVDSTFVDDELPLGAALESENKDVKNFATAVNGGFSVALKNPELGGSYCVRVYGYAKEPNTGFVILIDKVFQYPVPEEAVAE